MKTTRIKNALISVLTVIILLVLSLSLNAQDIYQLATIASNNNQIPLVSEQNSVKSNGVDVITCNLIAGSSYTVYFEASASEVTVSYRDIKISGNGVQSFEITPSSNCQLTLTIKGTDKKSSYAIVVAYQN